MADLAKKGEFKKIHTFKPIYDTKESNKFGKKFYFSYLYMPKSCKKYLQTMEPNTAYCKKKDAENHVSLRAIKLLYQNKYIDDHIYPVLDPQIDEKPNQIIGK